jgi:hypothetical protein
MTVRSLTRDEALLTLNDHLGEAVSVELHVLAGHDGLAETLVAMEGELARLYQADGVADMPVWERDAHEAAYMVGAQLIDVGADVSRITLRDGGLDFQLATNVVLSLVFGNGRSAG